MIVRILKNVQVNETIWNGYILSGCGMEGNGTATLNCNSALSPDVDY